jgi:hypothetical protein
MFDKHLVEALMVRLSDWPKQAVEELWQAMDKIEERHDLTYKLSDEERGDLEEAMKEAEASLVASDEEVRALFDRLGPPSSNS